jgi:thermitase
MEPEKVLDGIGVHVASLAFGMTEEATVQALQALPEVEFAEVDDRIIRPSGITPNDPSYPYQWALPDISAPTVWSTNTGSGNIVIAFLDSGVNAVRDLESRFVAGYNSTTTDVSGHGTLAAGAASAIGNNGIGVASPCWGCSSCLSGCPT